MQRWAKWLHGKKGSSDHLSVHETYSGRSSSSGGDHQLQDPGPPRRLATNPSNGSRRPAPTAPLYEPAAAQPSRGSDEGDPRVPLPSLSGGIPARSSRDAAPPSSPTTGGPTQDPYLYGRGFQSEDGPTQPLLMPSQHKPFMGFGPQEPGTNSLGILPQQQDSPLLPPMMVPSMQHSMLAALSSSPIASAAKLSSVSRAMAAARQTAQQQAVHPQGPDSALATKSDHHAQLATNSTTTQHLSSATPATAGSPLGAPSALSSYHSLTSPDASCHGQHATAPWTVVPATLVETSSFPGAVTEPLQGNGPVAKHVSQQQQAVAQEEDPLAVWSVLDESVGHASSTRGAAHDGLHHEHMCTTSLFDDASISSYAKVHGNDGPIPRHWLMASAAATTTAKHGSQHGSQHGGGSPHVRPHRSTSGGVAQQTGGGGDEGGGGGHSRTSSQLTSVHAPSLADLMHLAAGGCPSHRPSLRHLDSLDVYMHHPNSSELTSGRLHAHGGDGTRGKSGMMNSGGLSESQRSRSRSRSKHSLAAIGSSNVEQLLSLGINVLGGGAQLGAEASTPVMQGARQTGRVVSFDLLDDPTVPLHTLTSQPPVAAPPPLAPPPLLPALLPRHSGFDPTADAQVKQGSLGGPSIYSIAMHAPSTVHGESNHHPSSSYAMPPNTQGATSVALSLDRSTNNTVLASSVCLATTSNNLVQSMSSAPLGPPHPGSSNVQWLQEYLQSLGEDGGDKHIFVAHRHMRLPCLGLLSSFWSCVHGIRVITLVHTGIDDAGAVELAIGLRQSYSELWALDLRNNRIANKGAVALAGALRCCSSLREVVLSNNLIGDEGVQAFTDVLSSSSSPQRVRLSHNPASQEALKALATAYKGCRQRRARSRRSMMLQQLQEQQDASHVESSNSPTQGIFDNVLGSDEDAGAGSDQGPSGKPPPGPGIPAPVHVQTAPGHTTSSATVHTVAGGMAVGMAMVPGLSFDGGESPPGVVGSQMRPVSAKTTAVLAQVPSRRLNALMDVGQIQALIKVLFAPTLPEEHMMAQDVGTALIKLSHTPGFSNYSLPPHHYPTTTTSGAGLTPALRLGATISLSGIAVAETNSSLDMVGHAQSGTIQPSSVVDLDSLAAALTARGHDVVVTTSMGGGAGGECLQNLRHKYLTAHLTTTCNQVNGFDVSYECHSPVWSTHMTDLHSDMVSLSGFSVVGPEELASGPVTRNASTCSLYAAGQAATAAHPVTAPIATTATPPLQQQTSPGHQQPPHHSSGLPAMQRKAPRVTSYDGLQQEGGSTQLGLFDLQPHGGVSAFAKPGFYRPARASLDGFGQSARAHIVTTDASHHGDPSTGRASRALPGLMRPESAHGVPDFANHPPALPLQPTTSAQLLRAKSRNGSTHGGTAYGDALGVPSRTHVGSTAAQTIPELGSFTGSKSERIYHALPLANPSMIRMVIDPGFKEQFEIGKNSTDRYEAILSELPSVYVGQEQRLPLLVELLCEEMAAAFKEHGLPIPPGGVRHQ